MIPHVSILDRGDSSKGLLMALVEAAPMAMVLKGRTYSQLLGSICADCGHCEVFAPQAEDLYAAYLEANQMR